MSEVENKVLGISETKMQKAKCVANYFSADNVWEVTRKGCGTCVLSGTIVSEMLDIESKKKASKGTKELASNGATFKRVK